MKPSKLSSEMFSQVFDNFVQSTWLDRNSRLHQAIKYCLSGGGKRVRAKLAMAVCSSYGKSPRLALSSATSVEMVHAYSLAHDDLPCMDDDDMRRGRPSLHKAFDECTAVLAGDAILTDAIRVLVDEQFFPDASFLNASDRTRLVCELTKAAGGLGMVYGQDKDIYWTARENYNLSDLESIHQKKTGALMGAAAAMGAISAGADELAVAKWREFGILVGLAFQGIDDALDSLPVTGKTPHKDSSQKKLTYLTLFAPDKVLEIARSHTSRAINLIPGNVCADELIEFVEALIYRQR